MNKARGLRAATVTASAAALTAAIAAPAAAANFYTVQPGDTLSVGGSSLTMNVQDNDLAGNLLDVFQVSNFTANLSHGAEVSAQALAAEAAP